MEAQQTIHERRQLNYEIELAAIGAAEASTMIQVVLHTGMAGSVVDLYRRFYSAFHYLFILTSDHKSLSHEQTQKIVGKTAEWMHRTINMSDDKALLARCEEGYTEFMSYKKLLTEQGIIAMPMK